MSLTFREIAYGSDDYRRECALRDLILRKPLGLSLFDENLQAEREQLHFGLFDDQDELLCCAAVLPLTADCARIRQMAVAEAHQRQGLGRRMMSELEERLADGGFTRCVLHARRSAVEFYRRLGYNEMGEEFFEVTIPHVMMEKTIRRPAS
jgi:predicted GNAT family N-acyltransferase